MPIPFLLVGLGATAGLIGAGGHLSAQETNEKAQRMIADAQDRYEASKTSLESSQIVTKGSLVQLGMLKQLVLSGSMSKFVEVYNKIKNLPLPSIQTMGDYSNYVIDDTGVLEIQKMTDIYTSSLNTGMAGAATGAIVALAANGSLPIVTGGLGAVASALAVGEIGAAASIAGSVLSYGAAMTPLAAVAAPVILFTGISASMKADENLEKAQEFSAQVEASCEEMITAETLCSAIAEKSDMFYKLLDELNDIFSKCTDLLVNSITLKERYYGRELVSSDFTHSDLQLIAATRSIAGAVKAVLATPILGEDGAITSECQQVYTDTNNRLPSFHQDCKLLQTLDYSPRPIPEPYNQPPEEYQQQPEVYQQPVNYVPPAPTSHEEYSPHPILRFVMWILSGGIILLSLLTLFSGSLISSVIWIIAGLVMNPKVNKTTKFIPRLAISFALLFVGILLF